MIKVFVPRILIAPRLSSKEFITDAEERDVGYIVDRYLYIRSDVVVVRSGCLIYLRCSAVGTVGSRSDAVGISDGGNLWPYCVCMCWLGPCQMWLTNRTNLVQ